MVECHTGNQWRRGRKEICRCHVHTAFRLSPNFAPGEFSALQHPSCTNSGANGGATVSHFSPHRLPRWLRWWRIHLPVQETQEMRVHSRLGRPPAVGNGNPLQYSRLEIPTDGAAWRLQDSQSVGYNSAPEHIRTHPAIRAGWNPSIHGTPETASGWRRPRLQQGPIGPQQAGWSLLPQRKHAESQPRELWSGSETEPRRYLGLLA